MKNPHRIFQHIVFIGYLTALSTVFAGGVEAQSFKDCESCPVMVSIPAGTFEMGSNPSETTAAGVKPERASAEWPKHTVTIAKDFAIARNELTIEEFDVYAEEMGISAKGCFTLAEGSWKFLPDADWRSPGFAVEATTPAVCLSRDDYQGYMDWLSEKTGSTYRFPSEAEWEYVAQLGEVGPRNRKATDEAACSQLNAADATLKRVADVQWEHFTCDDGYAFASPVGIFGVDKLGLMDVFGNNAEYTGDCFHPNHENAPTNGNLRIEEGCNAVAVKGGSWAAEPGFLRPAFRVVATGQVRGAGFAVRLLREID